MMPHKRYLIYSRICKVIASLFGVGCALWGVMVGFFGPEYGDLSPSFAMRLFALFVAFMGALYLLPNKRVSTKNKVLLYMGVTLLVSLTLLFALLADLIIDWKQIHSRMITLNMLMTCFLPTLAAPASLFFYLKAYQSDNSV